MADLPVPPKGRYIGECIYCGATSGLSREHAIPYGINGPWTLLKASCKDCRDITHRFEHDTLRGLLPAIRAVFRMQTRHKGDRPKTLPLLVVTKGVDEFVQVPLNDFPVFLPIIEFPPPGVVAGRPFVVGIGPPVLDARHLAGPSRADLAAKFPDADYIGARMTFAPEDFGRTLAKIGFCAAVFALGLKPFRDTPIRDVILGRDPCIGHWVGSWAGEEQNPPNGLHAMKVRAVGADVHVILRLFAQFGAPEYHVALGPAAPEFVSSSDWPWQEARPSVRAPSGHRSRSCSEAASANKSMWLVIDTNQSRRIPAALNPERFADNAEGLSLPPYMMAELLPRGQSPRSDTLAAFAAHQVRIGVEPSMAIEAAAQLGAGEFRTFWPFPAPGDEIESDYRRLLNESTPTVTPALARWAETVKQNHHAFMTGMEARGIGARQRLKDLNVGTVEDFAEALKMTNGPDSFIGSLIVATFTNSGKRAVAISDPAELVRAVLANPYFRHFYHAVLYYIVSVTKLWKDPTLHREHHRNDWTDLTMALYVGDGDVLVTNDGLLRAVFAAIDRDVRVVLASDL